MGQDIKPAVRDQGPGELPQQVTVQNRHIRPQAPVNQGMLYTGVGQNGEIRHLRPGAGGGGDSNECGSAAGKILHGLGTIHGAAAPQSHDQIRLKIPDPGSPRSRQIQPGIRGHLRKQFPALGPGLLGYLFRHTVVPEERVRDHQCPPGPQLSQGSQSPGTADNPGPAFKSFHNLLPFSKLVFPIRRKSCMEREIVV